MRAVPTFFAGVLIAQQLSKRWRNFAASIWWSHGAFLLTLVPMHIMMRDEWVLVGFVLILLLAAAAEQNGAKSNLQHNAFVHLGNASFSFYMWHFPAEVAIFAVIGKFLGVSLLTMWGAAFLSYGTAVVVALLCYRYFEIPSRNAINGLLQNKNSSVRPRQISA